MGQVGHPILEEEHVIDLLPQVKDGHQDERQGDAPVFRPGEGGQEDEHEHDARGSQQSRARGQHTVGRPGDKGRHQHGQEQVFAPVFFLHRRADDEEIEHVSGKMLPAGVAQHMTEQADIGEGIGQGAAIDAEAQGVGRPAGEHRQGKGPGAQENIGEDDGGLVLDLFHAPLLII